jgi:DNA-directed RNA polymerase alpha subunit
MERREPIIEEEAEEEPEPQPETSSAGGVRPPGRIGGGLRDDEGGDEPPLGQLPIEALNLSMRAYNCLRRSGFWTLGDVVSSQPDDLLSLRNFGRKSFDEVCGRIADIVAVRAPEGSGLTEGSLIRTWLKRAKAVPPNDATEVLGAEWRDVQ